MKSETTTGAIETLTLLWQKLKNERIALGRRIEGLELALDALGYKPGNDLRVVSPPAPKTQKRDVANTTGHTMKYLVKEALYGVYPQGMRLRDIGTYLARRGVDPVLSDSISVSLTALKGKGIAERSDDGVWQLTEAGRTQMDETRKASS